MDRRAPLVPIGILSTCTIRLWPFGEDLLDRARALAVLAVAPDVGHVQEGGALEADVDEGRLHAGQHAHDLAEVEVADDAAARGALDVQLLHHAPVRRPRRWVSCG